mmetsp:Transcript_9535/g.10886  ORF Transcript_9535/g.10886 Transcript_9535/m.10886 type:complete len:375 (-) Transcript_9535:92-1216(-)
MTMVTVNRSSGSKRSNGISKFVTAAVTWLIFYLVYLLSQKTRCDFDNYEYSIMPQTASVAAPKDNEEKHSSISGGATSSLSFPANEENNLFPGLVQSGDGWSMWDRKTALSLDGGKCEWLKFKSLTGASADMCVYPTIEDKYVSGSIEVIGRFKDCDSLVKMWNQVTPREDRLKPVSDYYFLEIGVNIGACLIDVLMSTNARIIGFEANPRNAAHATHTLMAQPKDIRDRVAFFPVGLGLVPSKGVIYEQPNNRGNSVVNAVVAGGLPPIPIVLERLDAILPPNSSIVVSAGSSSQLKLIKMDVQGFECNIMDGGPHIFEASRAIKTELTEYFLKQQGCSSTEMMSRLVKAGFPKNHDYGRKEKNNFDFEAIKS